MRPIRLVMSAFGPYAGTQDIDFREATDAGLFGIYGPTGSGKSSIFNAMTFALFGVAAKEEQSISTLRSGHAPAELLTEVAFVFELGAKRYLVRRQPDQTRPKSRGEGETGHAHAAWLFDVSDVEVAGLDLQGCGTVLAERKVGQVGDQVRRLLGYGPEQFRQIVLLPQGRFERFLTSNSADRLGILRELFDVTLYRRMTETLREEAATAKREVVDGHRLIAQRLHAEGFASSDELETGIQEADREATRLESVAEDSEAAASLAEQDCVVAEALETRFKESEKADHELARFRVQAPEIGALRLRRDNASLARRAVDVHALIGVASTRQAEAEEAVRSTSKAVVKAGKAFDEAERDLTAEEAREGEIEAGQRRADELGRYRQALVDAHELKADHEGAVTAKSDAQKAEKGAADALVALVTLQREVDQTIEAAQQDEGKRSRLEGERVVLATKSKEARAHAGATDATDEARARAVRLRGELNAAEQVHSNARRRAAAGEQAYIAAQSRVLALRLADGEACPVCGALEHPAPAEGDGDPSALEAEWTQAREKLDEAAREYQEVFGAEAAARSLLAEREAQLATLGAPKQGLDELEGAVAATAAALEALGVPQDRAQLEVRRDELKEQAMAAQRTFDGARDALQRAITAEAVARRSYEDRVSDIPEYYRSESALDEALDEIRLAIEERKEALAAAGARLREATAEKASTLR